MRDKNYAFARQNLTVPAAIALQYARYEAELEVWKAATGFHWQSPSKAVWEAGGFEFSAKLQEDPNGWRNYGDSMGKFTPYWIKNPKSFYQWFLCADPKQQPHANFRKVPAFGNCWRFSKLTVEASVDGLTLSGEFVHGIKIDDSPFCLEHIEGYIYEMAGTVATGASNRLRKMCEAVLPS